MEKVANEVTKRKGEKGDPIDERDEGGEMSDRQGVECIPDLDGDQGMLHEGINVLVAEREDGRRGRATQRQSRSLRRKRN